MLRVDLAGEAAAVRIYEGQLWLLGRTRLARTLTHMREGEVEHLATVRRLMAARRVRPTALLPAWEAAGFALGVLSAALGPRAALAATVAVEAAISEHYNDQVRALVAARSGDAELVRVLARHRDEEVAHLDEAVRLGARGTPLAPAINAVVAAGCAAAIAVAKVV